MGEFIVRITDAFELDKPHLVGPDIGTSSTLFAAAAHPDRFSSLVIGSGGAAVPITVTGVRAGLPRAASDPVSYTHLTLPTILRV